MTTPQLEITEMEAAQSQPEIVVNEGTRRLEAALQLAVLDKDLTTPPTSPAATARYIVGAAATGAWAGQDDKVAFVQAATWEFLTPRAGWIAWVVDEGKLYRYTGSAWTEFTVGTSLSVIDVGSPTLQIDAVSTLEFTDSIVEDRGGGVARITPVGSGSGGGGSAADGHSPLTTLSIASGVVNIDHGTGADFDLQLTENVTTVNHNSLTNGEANYFTMRIRQDGTGARTFAPPASWTYPSGVSAYSPSAGANDVDLVNGVSYDNGTTWLISYEKDYT